VPGLDAGEWLTGRPAGALDVPALAGALAGADLVVVENVCSLPLNPAALAATAEILVGRPAIMRHHDLPWQRLRFADHPPPPDDPAWVHATINTHSAAELGQRGIEAVIVRNRFDPHPPAGDREAARAALGISRDELLIVQPTRAIARKRVDIGLALAERLGATFWLLGPAEEGFGPALEEMLRQAACPTKRGPVAPMRGGAGVEHAYAAADAVVFPSDTEGFGNPPVEASAHLRPVAVGRYPVAQELKELGFQWLDAHDPDEMADFLADPDPRLLATNRALVAEHLNIERLPDDLAHLIGAKGWELPSRH
jgi:glycosyltransferase involved in cell wall biosynthesis